MAGFQLIDSQQDSTEPYLYIYEDSVPPFDTSSEKILALLCISGQEPPTPPDTTVPYYWLPTDCSKEIFLQTSQLIAQLAQLDARLERRNQLVWKLRTAALEDYLTKLPNRRAWNHTLRHRVYQSQTAKSPIGLAMFDLDGFKSINQQLGFLAGDQVLQSLAEVIGKMAQPPGFWARLGGDEFGYAFQSNSSEEALQHAQEVARKLERNLHQHPVAEKIPLVKELQLSGGVAYWGNLTDRVPQPLEDFLFQIASSALRQAKQEGNGQIVLGTMPI
ncbi:Hypothetical protein PBC10988_6780 [Planctomycetales bacterium 10988]|nr:Hypothetical protein PBC10988_6780 [Planctomycetales bacterium 10988]